MYWVHEGLDFLYNDINNITQVNNSVECFVVTLNKPIYIRNHINPLQKPTITMDYTRACKFYHYKGYNSKEIDEGAT